MPEGRGSGNIRHRFQNGILAGKRKAAQKHGSGRKNFTRFDLVEKVSHGNFLAQEQMTASRNLLSN